MTLLEALRDPNLFGRHFRGKSWAAWRVFLSALTADDGRGDDLATYQACTGRTAWPSSPFTEAALIVGRRGGKSRILALIAAYLATMKDYAPFLAAGEVATIAVLAADKSQARAIFRFVVGFLRAAPLFEQLIVRRDTETIELSNRVHIEITAASFRSTRGYSYAAVLCDEVAFWHSEESSAHPDVEILRALRPGLASIPGAMLLIASSPYAKRGELYNAYRRHYGKDDARVLVWRAATATMNPLIDPAVIAEAYESDPEAAKAEYGAEFRDDLADFVTRETVDAVTMWGRAELPPETGVTYSAFCDPSGGISDSMTLAIGHLGVGDVCVLDGVLVVVPPFNPEQAVVSCSQLLRRYAVSVLAGDRYAGEWPVARFREHGIEFVQSARPKSDIYRDLLPLLNARRVELLDNPRLAHELCGLERRTARSGRDSVDHAPGAHDDLANSVAGVLVGLDLDRRPPMIDIKNLASEAGADAGDGLPKFCHYVFLLLVDAGADIAAVWCGSVLDYDGTAPRSPRTLYVLDADVVYFRPGVFDELIGRLRKLGSRWGARPAVLAPEAIAARIAGANKLPPDFNAENYVMFAADCISKGLVKFSAPAVDRMKTRTIGAALALKAGDEVETALRAALITAVWLKHGTR
jgi:hypothetical protein